jgi:hypothetical protein
MTNLNSPRIDVHRYVIKNAAQFETCVNHIGRPQFSITCVGDPSEQSGASVVLDEWLFADDLESLMREFFAWDARGIHMELIAPSPDEKRSANWMVVGLPAYLNRSARHLNARRLGTVCKVMGQDGARQAFLESVFEEASTYGFIALQAHHYNRFIDEWKLNDDKAAHPADYRAQKRFGVISAAGQLGVERATTQYWASIGWASGWLSERQLHEVGLTCDMLIGQTFVINGLSEVERIGNIQLPLYSG